MKKTLFLAFTVVMSMGVLLMGGMRPALALLTTNSDYQTYVVSSTSLDTTNFYGLGAVMISAAVGIGAMDALFSFNTSSIESQLNAQYGQGQWSITSIGIALYSNYAQAGTKPSNPDFNQIAAGNFQLALLGGNPNITQQTWNTLTTYLATTTATPVGTFNWTALASQQNQYVSYTLNSATALVNAIEAGQEVSFLGTAADNSVSYLFDTTTKGDAPELDVAVAPVPLPPSMLLLAGGLGGLTVFRRKR